MILAMPDHSPILSSTAYCLGLDYSFNMLGIAIGQKLTGTANTLTELKNNQGKVNWQAFDKIIQTWQPQAFILGLPLNMDGTEQHTTQNVKDFATTLSDHYPLPLFYMDERLSTHEASEMLGIKYQTYRKKPSGIDKLAAQLILQSWLNQQK